MKKWIWSVIGVIASLLILFSWFYLTAKEDYDAAERKAIRWTLELTSMTKVDHVEFFAGATNYTIVFGNNSDGEQMIVWVNDDYIHEEKASDGVTRSTIRNQVLERQGSVTFVHITPGKLGEVWVWEAFYKKQEKNGVRHYYDYYTFSNGEWLDTYTLSIEP